MANVPLTLKYLHWTAEQHEQVSLCGHIFPSEKQPLNFNVDTSFFHLQLVWCLGVVHLYHRLPECGAHRPTRQLHVTQFPAAVPRQQAGHVEH